MRLHKAVITIFLVILADQALKFWIKTNMFLGQEFKVFDEWFIIHFTENEGMAFGWELGGEYGKLFLTIFRLFAVAAIGYFLYDLIRKKAHQGFIISISLIFAGAVGNIIDSVFYGVIFSESNQEVAELFPKGGGYGTLLHGKVVDLFYFPLYKGYLPEWLPIWGGDYFVFFRPVFNLADASITVGVAIILLFQKRFFNDSFDEPYIKDGDAAKEESTNDNTVSNENQNGYTKAD